jgi:hypothetical protein
MSTVRYGGGPVSDLWCLDVSIHVHQNLVAGNAKIIYMQQDPSPDAFHACGLWLLLKKLDHGVGTLYTTPGFASVAVRLGPASYSHADYHENNGWDPETMAWSNPFPFRAYPILEIKMFPPTKVIVLLQANRHTFLFPRSPNFAILFNRTD